MNSISLELFLYVFIQNIPVMKKAITLNLFAIFLTIIFISKVTAQKIYSCESKYDADIKVFVVDSKYSAEWMKRKKNYLLY